MIEEVFKLQNDFEATKRRLKKINIDPVNENYVFNALDELVLRVEKNFGDKKAIKNNFYSFKRSIRNFLLENNGERYVKQVFRGFRIAKAHLSQNCMEFTDPSEFDI